VATGREVPIKTAETDLVAWRGPIWDFEARRRAPNGLVTRNL